MPGLLLAADAPRTLVFLPGFLSPAAAYRELLEPLAAAGVAEVRVPVFYRPGIPALLGHPSVSGEARAAAALVGDLVRQGRQVWLAGHSRGGQAAWLAAEQVPVAGLVLVDPVDGSGPRSRATTTARSAAFAVAPLVIGAGIGGRCAPEWLNHERFAAAAPTRIHVVVTGCGHADMLGGQVAAMGRRLCGGGADPEAARSTVTALIAAHLTGGLARGGPPEPFEDGGRARDDRWPLPVLWCARAVHP